MKKLDRLDWITRNRLVMKNMIKKISKQKLQNPKHLKVLFWGTMPWERGGVEHMLATAMRSRGHQIHGAWCSGGMSACSMESITYPRPDCKTCTTRHKKLLDIWGLDGIYKPTGTYISDQDRKVICNLIDSTPYEELSKFNHLGLPIGKLAEMDLPQFFFRLVDHSEKKVREYFRRSVKGVAEYAIVANNYLNELKPDRVVVTSGRTVAFSTVYQLCRMKNIPVTTWDESIGGLGAFIFAKNSYAVDYDKPNAWNRISKEKLSNEEIEFNLAYFKNTAKGKFGRHTYYNNPIENHQEIIENLGLKMDRPLTVLLSNLTWDTSALGKNIVYDDMIHWLKDSIEFFMNQPEKQLVVRTHPGEGHLAAYASGCESVAELLNRQYPNLPNNIKIVSGKEEISSHQLAEMAKTIVVYTTSVGLEMALRGRRVLVVGKSHYRNKGFTVDLETKDEYYKEIMNQDQNDSKISEEQIKLANKYAYYFIVRTETYLDEFNIEDRHQYQIIDPEHFLPGKSVRWDNLCNNLENQGDYVDCTGYIK